MTDGDTYRVRHLCAFSALRRDGRTKGEGGVSKLSEETIQVCAPVVCGGMCTYDCGVYGDAWIYLDERTARTCSKIRGVCVYVYADVDAFICACLHIFVSEWMDGWRWRITIRTQIYHSWGKLCAWGTVCDRYWGRL